MRCFLFKNLDIRYISDTGRYFILRGDIVVKIGNAPDFFTAIDIVKSLA